ncbi:MAG: sugar ABC transporter ATP-binding protein [Deltaproteobacteria bacterium]|nr:sugar ABC transporter ATP-binding protein [Deltaproteobacteria bacterium]
MTDRARLEMLEIVKRFPGTVALDRVDFDLMPGEVHALVGQNGAGKSTLIKVLAGIYPKDSGRILLDGEELRELTPQMSHRLGMRFIHQELNLVPWFSIGENIVLGDRYPRGILGTIRWRDLFNRASRVLERLGIEINPRTPAQELSVGHQWIVAIARALYSEGRIVVMDEPTASLSKREVEELFEVVRSLQRSGASVIYISHRLEEIFEIAQRVTVLKDGQRVLTAGVDEISAKDLASSMIGRSLADRFPRRGRPQALGRTVLSVSGLCMGDRLQGVDFELHQGEILGLAGLVGSGRTEVASALFGTMAYDGGEIRLDGKPVHIRSASDAVGHGIALVPEERRRQGLVLSMNVRENLTLANLRLFKLARWCPQILSRKRERLSAKGIVRSLSIQTSGIGQNAELLSGGNQQKLVLGKWLIGKNRVMIFDEPTRGIDVGSKFEIYKLVRRLAGGGVGILYISSELEELVGVCDRIIVLRQGRVIKEITASETTVHEVLSHCYGA